MLTPVALQTLVVTLSSFGVAVNIAAVVFAIRVHRKHMRILQVRPIGRAVFMGLLLVTTVQIFEMLYLSVLYAARAEYSSGMASSNLPNWVLFMSTGQYFVYYGENLIAPLVLLVVSWSIMQMPRHHGPFGNLPLDPRDLTDQQIEEWTHAMAGESSSRQEYRRRAVADARDEEANKRDTTANDRDRKANERDDAYEKGRE